MRRQCTCQRMDKRMGASGYVGMMEGWAETAGACVRLGMILGRRRDGWMDELQYIE